ncbi:MAG: GH36-type glycosyl hydrolase domain-containing protein, partial [Gemmatimonadota bacterium]
MAEWLLDNEYLTHAALRHVRETLGRGFHRDLPKLDRGGAEEVGLPRVLRVAVEILGDARSRLDEAHLLRFLDTYQEVRPLTIGETWALPAALQLATLEALERATAPLVRADESPPAHAPLTVVSNCIGNLRLIAGHDWKTFFERVSVVEAILRRDPADAYGWMEFDSRDRYRRAVEEIGRGGPVDEPAVARAALSSATRAVAERDAPPRDHVGYWLLDEGRPELERSLGARPARRTRRERWVRRHARPLYFGSIILLAAAALWALSVWVGASGATALEAALLLAAAAVPALGVSTALTNWVVSHVVPPYVLPKLDLGEGVPERFATMIAIPALLGDQDDVEQLVSKLEILQQGNSDGSLVFALLTDFTDAPRERMPGDEEILAAALRGVRRLNEQHRADGPAPFYLLHRDRRWNAAEECWMGWERKRGKLHDLDRMLLEHDDSGFAVREGVLDRLSTIRFVVTLDVDTGLPPGAAARLVGTLAHPLNRPCVSDDGRVTRGYTVLQPRIEIVLRDGASLFARLGQGATGLDLYTHAVSDVYQDLFGEGIYAGKGIYDVEVFERALAGRVPENALLSHDLFEG